MQDIAMILICLFLLWLSVYYIVVSFQRELNEIISYIGENKKMNSEQSCGLVIPLWPDRLGQSLLSGMSEFLKVFTSRLHQGQASQAEDVFPCLQSKRWDEASSGS